MLVFILKILSVLLGAFFIYCGLFLYENEEKVIQNKIESIWIKLSYKQPEFLKKHFYIINKISSILNEFFNYIFGEKLFSFSIILNSYLLSRYGASFISTYVNFKYYVLSEESYVSILNIGIMSGLFFLLVLFFIVRSKKNRAYLYILTFIALCYLSLDVYTSIIIFREFTFGVFVNIIFANILPIIGNVVILYICRETVRKMAFTVSIRQSIFLLAKFILIFFTVLSISLSKYITLPFVIRTTGLAKDYTSIKDISKVAPSLPIEYDFIGYSLIFIRELNLFVFFPLIALLSLIVFYLIHSLLWPLIIRPIYLLQRVGILKYKKQLILIGLSIIYFTFNSKIPTLKEMAAIFEYKIP